MSKRVRIGDVIEIPTSRGLAYAQFSHRNPELGALLRILPGFHQVRPRDLREVVGQHELYFVFFPLQASVSQGLVSVVAHEAVPDHASSFPLFRAPGGIDPKTSRVLDWWLWDGQREWRVGPLTPAQRGLPIAAIWTAPFLVERLEEGWTPSTDPRSQPDDEGISRPPVNSRSRGPDDAGRRIVQHYLYFPAEKNAHQAAAALKSRGYEVEVRPSADGVAWLVLTSEAGVVHSADAEVTRRTLELLARTHGGEYDGWESPVAS